MTEPNEDFYEQGLRGLSERRKQALKIPCPHCHAPVGEQCITSLGGRIHMLRHFAAQKLAPNDPPAPQPSRSFEDVVRLTGIAALERITGLTQKTPRCCEHNAMINYGLCSTCLEAARRVIKTLDPNGK
jgi:hypothetical protein